MKQLTRAEAEKIVRHHAPIDTMAFLDVLVELGILELREESIDVRKMLADNK